MVATRILSLELILGLYGITLFSLPSEANDFSEPAAISKDVPPKLPDKSSA